MNKSTTNTTEATRPGIMSDHYGIKANIERHEFKSVLFNEGLKIENDNAVTSIYEDIEAIHNLRNFFELLDFLSCSRIDDMECRIQKVYKNYILNSGCSEKDEVFNDMMKLTKLLRYLEVNQNLIGDVSGDLILIDNNIMMND